MEFQPLSRLLLLLGWTQCRSLSSAQKLLSILHQEQVWTAIIHLSRNVHVPPRLQILKFNFSGRLTYSYFQNSVWYTVFMCWYTVYHLFRHHPMTLFCRNLLIFCLLSLKYLSGAKTTIRKHLFFTFWLLTGVLVHLSRYVFYLLCIIFFVTCFFSHFLFRGLSMDALLAQLHTLDNHSALYILHSLTPLPQFEEHRILDLLQQLPTSPGTGLHYSHLLNACEKNADSVTA